MAKKTDFSKMSTKQKSRTLFLGTLLPLITIIAVANTLWAFISAKIINYYVSSDLAKNVESLNSSVLEQMDPIIVNIENFANFAELTEDDPEIITALVTTFAKKLGDTSAFYYASSKPLSKGGLFVDSGGFVPPESFDVTKRDWFVNAVEQKGELYFSDPYIDVDTNLLSITISKSVNGMDGKIKGVVACDIYLDRLVDILRKIEISKSCRIDLITKSGLYMTNEEPSRIMKSNYLEETSFPGDKKEWMDGTLKTLVNSKHYYAVTKIGPSPWYIVIEGNKIDFTKTLYNTIFLFEALQLIYSIIMATYNIRTIQKMRKSEQELGAKLFEETQTLVVAAKENSATSQDQSAAVKEIVATMEDSNALSESISSKIKDVSKVAENTSTDVATGVASIEQNVAQLHDIFNANQQTIEGMKVLSDKIESIWDIVTLINNVADQAKIIAFNAELEASSAGEAGKSFRIVANEIRRLSDGIIDGTKEIKEKINEIQHSSDSLILASESGTEKINAGYENAKALGERFASIKDSAEITANSASDITEIIQQQTNASEQILIALKQISAGVENFTVATDNISASSEHIRQMSEQMNKSIKSAKEEKNSRKLK